MSGLLPNWSILIALKSIQISSRWSSYLKWTFASQGFLVAPFGDCSALTRESLVLNNSTNWVSKKSLISAPALDFAEIFKILFSSIIETTTFEMALLIKSSNFFLQIFLCSYFNIKYFFIFSLKSIYLKCKRWLTKYIVGNFYLKVTFLIF